MNFSKLFQGLLFFACLEEFIVIRGIFLIMDKMENGDNSAVVCEQDSSENRKEFLLQPGVFIMHPLHGIGYVEKFESKEILGQECTFAVISFQSDKLKIMVNVNQKDSLIRNLIKQEDIPKILLYIKNFESDFPVKSSDRYNLNMKKIKSSDINMLAQVIKDLTMLGRHKKLTPKELAMLKQSKKTMATEFAFVAALSFEDAEMMIEESCRIA